MQTEFIQPASKGAAAFKARHIFDRPENGFAGVGNEAEHESAGRSQMGFTRRGDFMECAPQQPAAERGVDGRDTERTDPVTAPKAGRVRQALA